MRKQIVVCSLIALFLLTSTVSVSSYVGEDIEAVLTDDAHSVPDEPESETRLKTAVCGVEPRKIPLDVTGRPLGEV